MIGPPHDDDATPASPALGAHRLLASGRSLALVTPAAEVDWWCAPEPDSPPLLWSLLDGRGASARWCDASFASVQGRPAGPVTSGVVRVGGVRVECRDALVEVAGVTCLLRRVRSEDGPATLEHVVSLGGFDRPWGRTVGSGTVDVAGVPVTVTAEAGGEAVPVVADGPAVRTLLPVTAGAWSSIVVAVGARVEVADAAAAAAHAEADVERRLGHARLPRHHPERVADALAVLDACTYHRTGAVIASPTTSLPEAPGHDRQFDYRYTWLRDAALAVSVASLLGHAAAARSYLAFLCRLAESDPLLRAPVVDVRGGPVPEEREVPDVAGWGGSRPVRVGNAAGGQLQYDAWGLVAEAVSVHLQTGGRLPPKVWELIRGLADHVAATDHEESAGIWELRTPRLLVSGDMGRWLLLDRAIWIARGWRPTARRRHWKRARDETRARVVAAVHEDGFVPQVYGGDRPDASSLIAPLFGLLSSGDPLARKVVLRVIRDLEAGPYLYRYPPDTDDDFHGVEGTFLPMAWWAVAGLAVTGDLAAARARADELCAALPRLLPEEVDPVSGAPLGNVPLVWSHMELARAMYVLDAADIRDRFGAVGLWTWRLARYAALRWGHRGEVPAVADHEDEEDGG